MDFEQFKFNGVEQSQVKNTVNFQLQAELFGLFVSIWWMAG
jgi:hypothetical protein